MKKGHFIWLCICRLCSSCNELSTAMVQTVRNSMVQTLLNDITETHTCTKRFLKYCQSKKHLYAHLNF